MRKKGERSPSRKSRRASVKLNYNSKWAGEMMEEGRDGCVSAKARAGRGKIKSIRHHQKLCPYRTKQ